MTKIYYGKEQTPLCLFRRIRLTAEGILIPKPLKVEGKEGFDIFCHENKLTNTTSTVTFHKLTKKLEIENRFQRQNSKKGYVNGILFKNTFHLLLPSTCIFRQ